MDPFKRIDDEQRNMMQHPEEYRDRLILYDENDDDVNRHANRQLNQQHHLQIGTSGIRDFEREEKLRKYHQNIVLQKALIKQMEEGKKRKEDDFKRTKDVEREELRK